ncbi:MAG: hypothetical protein DSM106950_30070 [Stigonema ocellatum SAG 48.90 = DSM 106950]|nr:hypothetical protein [Stigonema ocellatum SAG 48.90 = DSM 106950]
MDLSIPGSTNAPLSTAAVFADNVQDLLGTGTLQVNPTGIITVNSTNDTIDDPNSGVTTLRDAISQANADSGEDLIVFDRSIFSTEKTITLKLGELDITHNLDIIAPRDTQTGSDLVTVSGNKASRVFEIGTGADVNIDGLIVADGKVTGDNGGGILNSGILTLDNSIVSNDSAINSAINSSVNGAGGNGGGIYNSGTISLSNSTISGNSAIGLGKTSGGGISNAGTATLSNSTISGNSAGEYAFSAVDSNGGGISNTGTVMLSNSTISGNSVIGRVPSISNGGGIFNTGKLTSSDSTISRNSAIIGGGIFNSGTATLSNSTISSNSAEAPTGGGNGGGIFNSGTATLSNSTISGNTAEGEFGGSGGGISNTGTLTLNYSTISGNSAVAGYGGGGGGISNTGTLTLSNSTISGNSLSGMFSVYGGGIFNSGTATLSNSTISGNKAILSHSEVLGGGIYNNYSATLTLLFSTITQNQAANGGGVYQSDVPPTVSPNAVRGSFSVRNTIIVANLNGEGAENPYVSGTFTSNGYNLIGDSTGSTGFGLTGDIVGTSDNPIDPRLDTLNSNGGPTQTIALLPDSPAILSADPTILDTDPITDQRGLPRRAADSSADIGAYELS